MDESALLTLNDMVGWPVVGALAQFVHWRWSGAILALVLLLWAWEYRRLQLVPVAILALVITDPLCAQLLKPLFARDRPFLHVPGLHCPFGSGSGFGLPSNHAANLFAIAAVFGAPWLYGLAALGSILRVVAGVHYPSDVILGGAVGMAVGLFLRRLGAVVTGFLKERMTGRIPPKPPRRGDRPENERR